MLTAGSSASDRESGTTPRNTPAPPRSLTVKELLKKREGISSHSNLVMKPTQVNFLVIINNVENSCRISRLPKLPQAVQPLAQVLLILHPPASAFLILPFILFN